MVKCFRRRVGAPTGRVGEPGRSCGVLLRWLAACLRGMSRAVVGCGVDAIRSGPERSGWVQRSLRHPPVWLGFGGFAQASIAARASAVPYQARSAAERWQARDAIKAAAQKLPNEAGRWDYAVQTERMSS